MGVPEGEKGPVTLTVVQAENVIANNSVPAVLANWGRFFAAVMIGTLSSARRREPLEVIADTCGNKVDFTDCRAARSRVGVPIDAQ